MRLVLLHGPGINASREKLLKVKKEFNPNNVIVFDKGANLEQVMSSLMTPSFLSDQQLIILENPSEDLIFDSSPISQQSSLILWFDKELGVKSKILNFVKENKGEIQFFSESKERSIFPFLDLLALKSPKAFIELKNLQKTHEKFSDIQYLLTMVFYLLRTLAVTPKNSPPFVKQKLEKQRKNFNLDQLANLYKEILEIDFKIKSGLLESPQAEFMLVSKFL